MKKLFLILVLLIGVSYSAYAQLGEKFTFGLRAGIGFGGFRSSDAWKLIGGNKESNWNITNNRKVTYNAGAIFDIPVYHKWGLSVQTGLWFTERTNKFEFVNSNNSATWRNLSLDAMYVQLPVQIGYHYNFKVVNVQALFGPFIEYRVNDGTSNLESKKSDIESDAFSSDDHKIGAGLTFGLGAEYKHSYLGIKYDLGLSNYYSGSNEDRKDKDKLSMNGSMFSIVLGWNF